MKSGRERRRPRFGDPEREREREREREYLLRLRYETRRRYCEREKKIK